jgi:uncharacterized protein involved in response to NO
MEGQGGTPAWQWFVVASVALALTAGFGLGGGLGAAEAAHLPIGLWWLAAAQGHGHIQVFGWVGLMVIGVAIHVLPRLRGAPLGHPAAVPVMFLLLVVGLIGRAVGQPLFTAADPGPGRAVIGGILLGSGALEAAGATVLIWVLASTLRGGPALNERPALPPVLPFFVTAFCALWLALAVNLVGVEEAVRTGQGLVPQSLDDSTIWLGFYGFLVPIGVSMSARTFPIFLRTELPRLCLLRVGLAILLCGLIVRGYGSLGKVQTAEALGSLAIAAALGLSVIGLGIFGRRRPLPRGNGPYLLDPVGLHMVSAYAWLTIACALLTLRALHTLGVVAGSFGPDAERHALGAGFGTLLILGVGAFLLPGMMRRRLRSRRLLWATLALANSAALLRVAPSAFPEILPATAIPWTLSMAGTAALAALTVFAVNVVGGPKSGKTVKSAPAAS